MLIVIWDISLIEYRYIGVPLYFFLNSSRSEYLTKVNDKTLIDSFVVFYSPLLAFLCRVERPFTELLSTVGFICNKKGRGNPHITVKGQLSYFLRVEILGLVPLRMLKSKIT